MKQKEINNIHQVFLNHYKIDSNSANLWKELAYPETAGSITLENYINLLTDSGSVAQLTYLKNSFSFEELEFFINDLHYPILVFSKINSTQFLPIVIQNKHGKTNMLQFKDDKIEGVELENIDELKSKLYLASELTPQNEQRKNELLVLTCYPYNSYYTSDDETIIHQTEKPTPLQRLLKLFSAEKKEISYIYIYAILASVLSLSLPLGVQAIIGIVSGGQIPTSVIVLILFIVLGILITGGIQLMQIYMVEHIKQKLFVKTAFEFAYRIPKLKIESVTNYYPPELMNRFFDIVTLQKGLSKILVEFSSAFIQIFLGLLLLTFYHPMFIIFGVFLVISLTIILWLTASKGLKTSLMESKYKYQLANWLEEIARMLSTFKLVGYSPLPLEKTDFYSTQYLHYRKKHFNILVIQYISFILFKTFITGGLLITGCILLIKKEINIGQFVASEIVIILVMNAVEKFILQLDTFYDVLTSIEKIGTVLDLPIEKPSGLVVDNISNKQSFAIEVKHLRFKFPNEPSYILKDINLKINDSERICLSGYSSSGKTTFVSILLGSLNSYEGIYTVNKISFREYNKNSIISHIGDNIPQEGLFDGTILENITLGRNGISMNDVYWAVEIAGLNNFIESQDTGLNTKLIGGNMGISEGLVLKIILARSIVSKPRMLILEDFLFGLEKDQKVSMLKQLLNPQYPWTIIIVSNDEEIMKLCDRTIIMKEGTIAWEGPYKNISEYSSFNKLI